MGDHRLSMRVVMLSQNDWRHDSRVIREAESLVKAGHDVHVLCRSAPGAPSHREERGGVNYVSSTRTTRETPRSLAALARTHAAVLARDARGVLRGPRRRAGAVSAWRLALFAVGTIVLPILSLQPIRRVAKLLYGAHASTFARDRLEPLIYLNDFARAAASELAVLEPDVIHAHDLITLSCGARAATLLGSRLVYDAHELETHTNYHTLSRQTKRWIGRYEAILIRRCDAVLTVSDSIADWLANEYEIARPIVVMNAPERISATPTRTLRETIGVARDTPLVVYVGSVTVDRGLELCVEALEHLPHVHFATVGWRYEETERRMIEKATHLGVGDRLHFVDPVPSREVIGFIADADASVMAIQNVCLSYYFCFPNKLLESVFAGLPVAVADLVELRRFIDENPVGLVMDERTSRSIASTLEELLLNVDRFRPDELRIQEIARRYGWEAQESRLWDLYGRLEHKWPRPSQLISHVETAKSGV